MVRWFLRGLRNNDILIRKSGKSASGMMLKDRVNYPGTGYMVKIDAISGDITDNLFLGHGTGPIE